MSAAKVSVCYVPRNKGRPFVVRWYGEADLTTARTRRYSKGFRTRREANKFAVEKKFDFSRGARRDRPDDIALGKFCREWLSVKRSGYRSETVKLYENTIRRLLDHFGRNTVLRQITPRSAAAFVAGLKPFGPNKVRLSSWSQSRILRNAKTMFATAVEWQLVTANPFASEKRPKCTVSRWHYFTPDEYGKLLSAAPTLRWKAFLALGYTAGLRLGELLSLTWDKVDLSAVEVRIESRRETATQPPFNVKDDERRTIWLPKHTVEILSALKGYNEMTDNTPYLMLNQQQYETLLAKWKKFRQQRRGWTNRDFQNNTLTRFKEHCEKAEIRPDGKLTIHGLRKSCITNWAKDPNLTPKTVQVLAGHSDLATTMRYYVQVDDDQRQKAAAGIDELLVKVMDQGPGYVFGYV